MKMKKCIKIDFHYNYKMTIFNIFSLIKILNMYVKLVNEIKMLNYKEIS